MADGSGPSAAEWNEVWSLALVFGAVSVPWTYGFGAAGVPLWPAFVASASFFATRGGVGGLGRAWASNTAGVLYATATLAVAVALGDTLLALSLVVGVFMALASLHAFVGPLSFTPGAFFGYATLFSVHAAGATAFGLSGLAGETVATLVSMGVGVCIGFAADRLADRLARVGTRDGTPL